jgi:hypothetical protein
MGGASLTVVVGSISGQYRPYDHILYAQTPCGHHWGRHEPFLGRFWVGRGADTTSAYCRLAAIFRRQGTPAREPNICAAEGAPGLPSSMVLGYIHPVSAISSILVLTIAEPLLSRFSSRLWGFQRFWTDFPYFEPREPPKHTLRVVLWRWRGTRHAFRSARTVGGAG